MKPRTKKSKAQSRPVVRVLNQGGFDLVPPPGMRALKAAPKKKWAAPLVGIFFLVAIFGFTFGSMHGLGLLKEPYAQAQEAAQKLEEGFLSAHQRRWNKADEAFAQAEEIFDAIEVQLAGLNYQNSASARGSSSTLFGDGVYLSALQTLLESAQTAAVLGREAVRTAQETESTVQQLLPAWVAGRDTQKALELFDTLHSTIDDWHGRAVMLQRQLATLPLALFPPALSARLAAIQGQTGQALAALDIARTLLQGLQNLAGAAVPHRILVVFQNDGELRPTGGFMGSLALVDLNDGRMVRLEPRDIYENDNQVIDLLDPIPAPPGLDEIVCCLSLRDANSDPDFPTSAKAIRTFFERGRGESFDTLLAIDTQVAEALLDATGPLHLKKPALSLNAGDFASRLSYFVEGKITDAFAPKKILFSLIPEFLDRIRSLSPAAAKDLLQTLIAGRHLQAYSFDPAVQKLWQTFGMDGALPQPLPATDMFQLTGASIGGNKSDRYLSATLHHHTQMSSKARLQNTFTLTRTHGWNTKDTDFWTRWMDSYGAGVLKRDEMLRILGAGDNRTYFTLHVPLGSKLLSATGVEVSSIRVGQAHGYTTFGWHAPLLKAGTTQTLSIRYALPFAVPAGQSYTLQVLKQAGTHNISVKKTFSFPPVFSLQALPQGAPLATLIPLDRDLFFALGGF